MEKEAQKAAQEKVHLAQINEEIVLKVFTGSLSSYKQKDDLITLAGALQLDTTGTVAELGTRVKTYVEAHPELAENARFAGIFQHNRQVWAEDNPIQVVATSSTTFMSPDHPLVQYASRPEVPFSRTLNCPCTERVTNRDWRLAGAA